MSFFFPVLLLLAACSRAQPPDADWQAQRALLVKVLQEQGIDDLRVLAAMDSVPRHEFVPDNYRRYAYANSPLPIGYEQTISQPFIVAYMCQAAALKPTDRVLEIGTGSGYHAAVMSLLASEVYTIEIVPELGESAAKLLEELSYANIQVRIGDGYQGWAEHAPFDAVILTAAPPDIPQPLIDQLALGGRLIAPVGEGFQELVRLTKTPEGIQRERLIPVRFVPMTGEAQEK